MHMHMYMDMDMYMYMYMYICMDMTPHGLPGTWTRWNTTPMNACPVVAPSTAVCRVCERGPIVARPGRSGAGLELVITRPLACGVV